MNKLISVKRHPSPLTLRVNNQVKSSDNIFRWPLILLHSPLEPHRTALVRFSESQSSPLDRPEGSCLSRPALGRALSGFHAERVERYRQLDRQRRLAFSSMLMSERGSVPYKHLRSICLWSIGIFLFLNLCLVSVMTVSGNPERLGPFYSGMTEGIFQAVVHGVDSKCVNGYTCEK